MRWIADGLEHPWFRAAVVLVVGFIVVRALSAAVQRQVRAAGATHWAVVARKIATYAGVAAVLLGAARAGGLDLRALIATAGVATVAVGFAAQTSLSNLIAGVFLLLDRPFKVGDTIEVDGRMGVVTEVSLMSTHVRAFDNVVVRWPNEVLLKATIMNFTKNPARRVEVRVRVPLDADLPLARQVLAARVHEQAVILLEPPPEVLCRAFLDSAVELEIRAWVASSDFLHGRTAVIEAAQAALHDAGIPMPFPTHTLQRGSTDG